MGRRGRKSKDTLCWECKNSVPNVEKLRGCSWSMFFIPVKGWEAEPRILKHGYDENNLLIPPARSYHVISCPYFEKG